MTGTSASTPLWAGFMALANRQAQLNGQQPVGFLNPVIYAIGRSNLYGADFKDINNGTNGDFTAVSGYDLVTGWGSPTCTLIAQLASPRPLLPTQVAVESGASHTCALLSDQTAHCWGTNVNGELGDGTTTTQASPVKVISIGPIASISCGGSHTCAVLPAGTVSCWGANDSGQLGNGTTTGVAQPVDVNGLTNVTAVSAGSSHTCALLANATVSCWGSNDKGQLGDGTTTSRSLPAPVTGLNGVLQLRAGASRTCAVTSDQKVYCWGYNAWGALGDGTGLDRSTPTQVTGLPYPLGVALGQDYTCARTLGGAVYCWDESIKGQFGDGFQGLEISFAPKQVPNMSGATQIAAKSLHTCVVISGGEVECWGSNVSGQAGDGNTANLYYPMNVTNMTTAVGVTTSAGTSCALTM